MVESAKISTVTGFAPFLGCTLSFKVGPRFFTDDLGFGVNAFWYLFLGTFI
jgi:hypothetical protein